MSLALTDRPVTEAATRQTKSGPLVVDPILDAPPAPPGSPNTKADLDTVAYWERLQARARRRRWASRAALAVPVLAAAVLATPIQDRQAHIPSPGRIAVVAPSPAGNYQSRAGSGREGGCLPLWFSVSTATPACLFPAAPSGRSLP